ncbi:MAG: hypothetical protein Q9186_005980 [Xanthomendoza sp. 1 TL-2023]
MDQQVAAESAWRNFFELCLLKRVPSRKFLILFREFEATTSRPLASTPESLTRALLDAGHIGPNVDPRLAHYLEALLDAKEVDSISLLIATARITQRDNAKNLALASLGVGDTSTSSVQVIILKLLTRKIVDGAIEQDTELLAFLVELLPWITQNPSSMTLGFLVSATLGCTVAQEVLPTAKAKKFKTALGQCLTPMINNLSSTNIQLASILSYAQKQYDLNEEGLANSADPMNVLGGVDLGVLPFQDGVVDNINTRAGLYIYLNAAGDITTLVIDLILASFDILANAMYRAEPPQTITILRSFLVNKLPIFLGNYTAIIFPPLSIETCISQALLRVDPAAFPSFSQMFDFSSKNSMVSEARQEFLFACALHQLIPEGSIEGLLGDVPMQSLPASGRYMKNELVTQCTSNPMRIEELIGELDNMEGNAGEIAGALIEIITTLCSNNDTMTLKCICNCLIRRSATLDTISLFCSPETILQPLCQLLDNWQEHEDQVENQPVYDEFGSVLLLVSVIRHRFELDLSGLGMLDQTLFTSQYFRVACESRLIDSLSLHENDLLGGWIRGLFEAEGINDELMSTCKPAEFHLLVATLFDQSIKACQAKVLTLEALKGGFEYLLEPFLLPSLAAGLIWFAHTLWSTSSTSTQVDTLLPALHTLIKPPSMSVDSAAIHSAVLSTVAQPLDQALNHTQRQHKNRVDINPLLETLRPHMTSHRQKAAALTELESWASTPSYGLVSALPSMIRGLILWCLANGNLSPPNYTHRLLLHTQNILGSKATLKILLDELMTQATQHGPNAQDVETTFDIIITMLIAPQPSHHRLTLLDALRTHYADINDLSKTDIPRANMLARLHRRAEAFAATSTTVLNANNEMNIDLSTAGQGMMLHDSQGMPATDIDDVLAHTEGQIASGDFLGGVGLGSGMEL